MSSCELPSSGQPSSAGTVSARGSRIHRFAAAPNEQAPHTWSGVPLQDYKQAASHHCGVLRQVLVGDRDEATQFQVRYFEIAPEGFSTLEHHRHEHVVVVMRGRGLVRLQETTHEVGVGDVVYVAPDEVHQLTNPHPEPFGFLCVVDTIRDTPVVES